MGRPITEDPEFDAYWAKVDPPKFTLTKTMAAEMWAHKTRGENRRLRELLRPYSNFEQWNKDDMTCDDCAVSCTETAMKRCAYNAGQQSMRENLFVEKAINEVERRMHGKVTRAHNEANKMVREANAELAKIKEKDVTFIKALKYYTESIRTEYGMELDDGELAREALDLEEIPYGDEVNNGSHGGRV